MTVTASIGIAYADQGDDRTPEQLLHDADMAMYQAKHQGGARQQLFDPREQRLADRQAGLERDLHHAVQRRQLHLRIPAHRGHRRRADHRIRGAAAVAAPDPRHGPADHAHPPGRTIVPDHRHRRMGPRPGLGRPEPLATTAVAATT